MSRALGAALEKLHGAGEGACSSSALTRSQREALEQFARETGCVRVLKRGRGWVYEIIKRSVFDRHLADLRPDLASGSGLERQGRSGNVATRRDSKAGGHQHANYYLLLKAADESARWLNNGGVVFNLDDATQSQGAGVLQVTPGDGWYSQQPLWLVENQAVFDDLDWVDATIGGSVAYYAGNLPRVLLQWLAARRRASRIILFADYDGVGLDNYRRLKDAAGDAAEFWLMPQWHSLIERYGNRTIWENNVELFESARKALATSAPEDPVHDLIEVLAHYGMMLEQEAVVIPVSSRSS